MRVDVAPATLALCLLATPVALAGAPAGDISGHPLYDQLRAEVAETLRGSAPALEGALAASGPGARVPTPLLVTCLLDRLAALPGSAGEEGSVGPAEERNNLTALAGEIAASHGPAALPAAARRLIEGSASEAQRRALESSRRLLASGAARVGEGDWESAVADLQQASARAREIGDDWLEMHAGGLAARAELEIGLIEAALSDFAQTRGRAEKLGDDLWLAEASRWEGEALIELGRPREALDRLVLLLDLPAARAPGPWRIWALGACARACAQAAVEALDLGDLDSAERFLAEGFDHAEGADDRLASAHLMVAQADLLRARRRDAEAVLALRGALAIFREEADDAGMDGAAARLGALLERSAPLEAVMFYREAAEAASALADEQRVGQFLAASAEVALRSGLLAEAAESLRIAQSEQWGRLDLEATDRVNLCQGHLALQQDRAGDAAAAYDQVRGATQAAREARWGRGVALLRIGRDVEAAASLLEALPPGALPPRSLLEAALDALDRTGRAAEARALARSVAGEIGAIPESTGDWRVLALRAALALRAGRHEAARELTLRLAGIEEPEAALDAASLLRALDLPGPSHERLAASRRLRVDPVRIALDPRLAP